jgi:hypothetical protein
VPACPLAVNIHPVESLGLAREQFTACETGRSGRRSRKPPASSAVRRSNASRSSMGSTVTVDENPTRTQEAALLAVDLATNAFGGGPVRGAKFG